MTTRIGLIGDIHAFAEPLEEALSIFRKEGVDRILCIGDVAGYGSQLEKSVALLRENDCITVLGNHEAWYLEDAADMSDSGVREYFLRLPLKWESVIEEVGVYAVHASPPDSTIRGIRLLDENGGILHEEKDFWTDELTQYPFDILIVGHTHQVFAEMIGEKLVINPGSTRFNHTCAILSLPEKGVRIVPLSGKEPLKSWNWGMIAGIGTSASKE